MNQRLLQLSGIFPPISTPFNDEGKVAVNAITKNLSYLNQFDLKGYVVLGSNGEYVLLTEKEKLQVLETARSAIPTDRLMIAGTGCQATNETAELTKKAASIGADAALVITPSYYRGRMTPEALIKHYRIIADVSPIPIIMYNMPRCTGIDLEAVTIAKLSEHPNIIGLKDSGVNIIKTGEIRRLAGSDFQVLAGSASLFLPALSVGAVGGIMALANIAPVECLAVYQYFLDGERDRARNLQLRLIPVNVAITSGWGVPALKAAMDILGLYGGPVRLPLLPLTDELKRQLETILSEGGIQKINTSTGG